MWIRDAYMLYNYVRLYAYVMIELQCLYYIVMCLCYD
jgi:hypothetical protein